MKDNKMEAKKDKIAELANKVKEHASSARSFNVRNWMLYVAGGLLVAVLVFGAVQQARIWRWQKIMKSAKNKILELDTENGMIRLKTIRKLTEKAVEPDKKKIIEIDKKLKELEKKKIKIGKSVDKMTPSQLLKAFKDEDL